MAEATCDPAQYAQELELSGLGTVYVGDLSYESASDTAELSNGLCFSTSGEPDLTLTAPTMRVTEVSSAPRFSAAGANLTLGIYTLFAADLSGDAQGISLQNLSISSSQFSGTVTRARYSTLSAQTILSGVKLRIGTFRVESVSGGLTQRTLVLQDARASTCTCESGGLYTLRAPSVAVNLQSGGVRVERGALEVFGVRVALNTDLRLQLGPLPRGEAGPLAPGRGVSVASPSVLGPGPTPEPVGSVIDEGAKVALPLQLWPWALLELGVAGLDEDHRLGAVSLLKLGARVGQADLRAALGRVGPGWRADALIRQPLSPNLGLDLSTTNRLWEEAGYLHDGALSLFATRTLTGVVADVADSLALGGKVFAALSRQTLVGVPISSWRLGAEASATYTSAPTPLGNFSLLGEADFTFYPQSGGGEDDLTQLGLRALPSWRTAFGPLTTALSYDVGMVLGGSPFSVEFDRLEPRSTLDASATLNLENFSVSARGRYAFILNEGANPVRQLRVDASRITYLGKIKNSTLFSAEFAGLLGPSDVDTDAFVSAESSFDLEALGIDVEFGLKTRFDLLPETAGLKLLEFYGSVPIELSAVTLKPFLGVNVAPYLTGTPLPTLTGYGLEVAYRSCCGTLRASYRFHDETAVTTFDIQLTPAAQDR